MNFNLGTVLTGVIAGVLASTAVPANEYSNIADSTYQIIIDDATCSAQAVSEKLLYTAGHCLDGAKKIEVLVGTEKLPAEIVAFDTRLDMGVIRVEPSEDTPLSTVPVATKEELATLSVGDVIVTAGFPGTRARESILVISDGLFVGELPSGMPDETRNCYLLTAPAWYGSSGGGVYKEFSGTYKLIGVMTDIDTETPWFSIFSTPVYYFE